MERRGFLIGASDGDVDISIGVHDVVHLDTSQEQQNGEIIALLLQSWLCLLADSPLNVTQRSRKPRKSYLAFRKAFLRGPLKGFVLSLAKLADEIVSTTSLYGSSSLTGRWLPEMYHTPIFTEYKLWYESGDATLLTWILSFLYFGKKLSYQDSELNSTAFREWNSIEEKLSDLKLDDNVTSGLNRIVAALVPDIQPNLAYPKFGPGKVAERGVSGVISKSNNLFYDRKLDRAFFKGHFANYGLSEGLGFSVERIIPDPETWKRARSVSGRVSRKKFVAKDVSKSRTICMEPNSYMFFQQCVASSLTRTLRKSCARRFIDIGDQSRNRDLARYGSHSGELDTIDLSSASDSVSVELVRAIFPRKALYYLLATRTSKVRTIIGTIVDVKKFAPMGSALCFPVQCVVFTSVVIYAAMLRASGLPVGASLPKDSPWLTDVPKSVRRLFRRTPGPRGVTGSALFEPAAIYGDDICVDGSLTQYVTHLLSSLGFSVNIGKSFTGSCAFRESCGGYYHDGEDVTPLRFRVKRYWGKIGPKSVASMIACANLAGDKHYVKLRRCYIQRLLYGKLEGIHQYHGVNSFYFTNNKNLGYGIYSQNPRNDHLESRWSPCTPEANYQRDERRCIMLTRETFKKPTIKESDPLERYLYVRWWGSRSGIVSLDIQSGASRSDTSGARLVRRWIPD